MATNEVTERAEGKLALHHAPTAGMLLVKIGRAVERWYTEALKPSGLTPRHLGVLFEVQARPTSQQALIDSIGVDPSKLVGLLNDLEADGLIVRRRDPEDRRRHIVEVSKVGRTRLQAAEKAAAAVEDRLFAGIDAEQRAELLNVLAQIADSTGILEGCLERIAHPD
jgi:MarR family transcriptional regulator, lower aerobic nicotinate degradation pathway regulator